MWPRCGAAIENLETVDASPSSKNESYTRKCGFLSSFIFVFLGAAVTAVVLISSASFSYETVVSPTETSQISLGNQKSKSKNRPNFIIIVADDMSLNSIGYQPYDLPISTPFLTKLSSRGIRNLNYYGQEICSPSRSALLTGSLYSFIVDSEIATP